ncbi:hypothetical protein ENSA5_20950 [Enhygromyxa salina]|uniref:Uncharacterized protein n=1 Tax=Enhygromyxa salina TaxID=215803 RepID=A0A2S9YCC6_9BACT|nr:hypothetical protein [Enhygromyxa salina]PRQ02743.1 hypothetical protein ENSA5_20950 [Enhygromyxa salina]
MKRILAISTLLLIPNSGLAEAPDLCAEVYLDADGSVATDDDGTTVSRFCEPTGPTPPVWAQDICCELDRDDARCVPPDANGRCRSGFTMWCEYGELIDGRVACYQPFDDACDAGYCQATFVPPAEAGGALLCCNGPCVGFDPKHPMCDGELYYCWAPYQHQSGVVECYGGEPF